MKIVYYDGGELNCHEILFNEKELIVDDVFVVPIIEVQRIFDDDMAV